MKPNKVFIKMSSFPVQGASSCDGHPLEGAEKGNNFLRSNFANKGGNRVASSFIPKKA